MTIKEIGLYRPGFKVLVQIPHTHKRNIIVQVVMHDCRNCRPSHLDQPATFDWVSIGLDSA